MSAWFDGDELVLPLTIRSRLPGDTIRVMGLNGSKKVKDIYIDDKIPSSERSAIPSFVMVWAISSGFRALGARCMPQ